MVEGKGLGMAEKNTVKAFLLGLTDENARWVRDLFNILEMQEDFANISANGLANLVYSDMNRRSEILFRKEPKEWSG